MRKAKRKTTKGDIIALFVTGLIMLGLAEIVCHGIEKKISMPAAPNGWAIIPEQSWIEYHPTLGWFHQKNKQSSLSKNGQQTYISTNHLGMRSARGYSLEKPDGIFRVYALGDSFTFGFGVEDNQTFPAVMEKTDSRLEVFNLGVPGYGVDQISLLLNEFGFKYNPDFIFIVLYPEDFWRALRAFNDGGYGKPYYTLDRDGLKLRHVPVPKEKKFTVPQFPEIIRRNPFQKILDSSALYRTSRKAWMKILKNLGSEDPDTSTEWMLGREILKKTMADIKKQGIPSAIVLVPPQRWLTGTDEPVRQSLIRFGQREGVDVLDLTPVFEKACARDGVEHYYIPYDLHWTPEGNTLTAKTLMDYLDKKGFLKK